LLNPKAPMIKPVISKEEYPQLLQIWEASVSATHTFLTKEKISEIKQIITESNLLANYDLYAYCLDADEIKGFLALSKDKIEMLFIHPDFRGHGIGKKLTSFAIKEKNVSRVDVNEQNEQAVGFYLRMGFKISSITPLDDLGNPFPILKMVLS
jgi:putative acetyltransferase